MDPEDLPALVDEWLTGFCVSRRVTSCRDGDVVEVAVHQSSRRLEHVLVDPSPSLLTAVAARLVGTDDVWLSAFTSDRRSYALPVGVQVRDDDETLMTTLLTRAELRGDVEADDDGDRALAAVHVDDERAAEGQVAVVGDVAVFDRIRTHDAFQRQGHGSAVMGALTAWALDRGAHRGVLAASAEGRALYTRLGWRVVAGLTTWVGAPDVNPS